MVKAGVPEKVITNKIFHTANAFDVTPSQLIILTKIGVAQQILDVMVNSISTENSVVLPSELSVAVLRVVKPEHWPGIGGPHCPGFPKALPVVHDHQFLAEFKSTMRTAV